MTTIFWLIILILFGASIYFWKEEWTVKTKARDLIDEVEAYLTKRRGGQ